MPYLVGVGSPIPFHEAVSFRQTDRQTDRERDRERERVRESNVQAVSRCITKSMLR